MARYRSCNDAFPSELSHSELDGANGFIIKHDSARQLIGVGDVNADGVTDMAIAGNTDSVTVVFGLQSEFPAMIETADSSSAPPRSG